MKIHLPSPTKLMGGSMIGKPLVGATQTFITLGAFDTEQEALNCQKYIKTKFARALLAVKKVTQEATLEAWEYVPQQDFTSNSDIDWSKSIREIDRQLYDKYGLSKQERGFIERGLEDLDAPPKPKKEKDVERSLMAKIVGHAQALAKMRRTKFYRLMSDLMKLAQFGDTEKQAEQFCTEADDNDIDWCAAPADIDAAFYKKYGFTRAMIDFVERRYSYDDGAGVQP